MHARVTTFENVKTDKIDAGVRLINEQVVPAAQTLKGFKGGYWLADRQRGKLIAMTLWETEEDLHASENAIAWLRDLGREQGLVGDATVEHYEVIAEA